MNSETETKFQEYMNKGEKPFDYEKYLILDQKERVKAILKGENPPPYELEIQASPYCDAECRHCFGTYHLDRLGNKLDNREAIDRLVEQVVSFDYKGFVVDNVKFCGSTGDPLSNNMIREMVDSFYEKKGKRKIIMFTNGLKLGLEETRGKALEVLSKVNRLNLSLDAGSTPTLWRVKPGALNKAVKLERILEGAKELQDKGINVTVGYVITAYNYYDIANAAKIVKEHGLGLIKYRVDMFDRRVSRAYGNTIVDLLHKAKSYEEENFKVVQIHDEKDIRNEDEAHFSSKEQGLKCFTNRFWASIGSNGEVYPCGHVSMVGMDSYGNILEIDFHDIWNG